MEKETNALQKDAKTYLDAMRGKPASASHYLYKAETDILSYVFFTDSYCRDYLTILYRRSS